MRSDPYVSAVITLRSDEGEAGGEPPVQDPQGVASEAAAVLEGGNPAPHISARRSGAPADIHVPEGGSARARAKGYFTNAGFEVHGPLGLQFSIGAPRSRFESFFDKQLDVDEEHLGSPVTVAGGGRDLGTERLPAEVRHMVESVLLPEPPEFPPGIG